MPPLAQPLSDLPPAVDLETVVILKALNRASRALAALKGQALTIPNPGILIDTLLLQEARASSGIENIVTSQDTLLSMDLPHGEQEELFSRDPQFGAAKEVFRYREALRLGFDMLKSKQGLILNSTLTDMYRLLKQRSDGFRATPGTELRNEAIGEVVFVPPQDARAIVNHMTALERFINDEGQSHLDPLIKMALIHHQFESIHPFADGNGRIGRILNVLYLTRAGLLDSPILYLSRYIMQHKSEYYRLLQAVRNDGAWQDWILFMLDAVEDTSVITTRLVKGIGTQMATVKHRLRTELPKLYSHELLNILFRHPYTRIEFVQRDLGKTRQTASKYLGQLAELGLVERHLVGKRIYYVNVELVRSFARMSPDAPPPA